MKPTIGVYKVGKNKYNGIEDKNGGLKEYNLLIERLLEQRYEVKPLNVFSVAYVDIALILSGRAISMGAIRFNCKKQIFILTDISCIKGCEEIIKSSDLVLTQTTQKLPIKHKNWQYGFFPELFFDPDINPRIDRKSKITVFGGTTYGREKKIESYFMHDGIACSNTMLFLKDDTTDERLPYESYMKVLNKAYATVTMIDKASGKFGIVTPRFIETINRNVISFVDSSYDKHNIWIPKHSCLRVADNQDIATVRNIYADSEFYEQIKKYRIFFESRRNNFFQFLEV